MHFFFFQLEMLEIGNILNGMKIFEVDLIISLLSFRYFKYTDLQE